MPSVPRTPSSLSNGSDSPQEKSWRLKSTVAVFRHADRTPKCNNSSCFFESAYLTPLAGKLKFNFKGTDAWTQPFITLLQGRTNEIILRDPEQLQYIADAAEEALQIPGHNAEQLEQLKRIIEKKSSSEINSNGTKAQLKPTVDANGNIEKVVVVVKWGGEVSRISGRDRS